MQRYLRHLVLLKLVLLSLTAAALVGQMQGLLERMSLWSGWLCVLLFAATLMVGPWTLHGNVKPATNILLRRDLGIWAAVTGLIHFALGTAFSMNPEYISRFVVDELGQSRFFWGSIWGTVAGLLVLILLVISNNRLLAKLGAVWWKRLQRLAYPAFLITVIHGVYFQLLEQRSYYLYASLALLVLVASAQLFGMWRYRQLRRQ